MASSPASSLTSLSSVEDIEEAPRRAHNDGDHDTLALPPSKRRKLTASPRSSLPYGSPRFNATDDVPDDISDISSDTSGSVQGSPKALKDLAMPDEDIIAAEQVRTCRWDGCSIGELGNLDELVNHLSNEHVNAAKTSRYTCGWYDCKATGKTQMSAYALKAHLRSHTKEKPFYCALPECDSSFTRSDALAKHMRTVHANETAKTLEHYGKNPHAALFTDVKDTNTPSRGTPGILGLQSTTKPPQRFKLLLNANKGTASSTSAAATTTTHTNGNSVEPPSQAGESHGPLSPHTRNALFGQFPPDLDFSAEELDLPRNDLFRLLRRQLHWATQASTNLNLSVADLETTRKSEFMAKELALENAMEAAYALAERKGLANAWSENGVRGLPVQESLQAEMVMRDEETESQFWGMRKEEGEKVVKWLEADMDIAGKLPLGMPSGRHGGEAPNQPWYRTAEWNERRKELEKLRGSGEGGGHGGDEGPDDEIDDAALLDDADEADEELEAPDEEVVDVEDDGDGLDEELQHDEQMDVDERGAVVNGHAGV